MTWMSTTRFKKLALGMAIAVAALSCTKPPAKREPVEGGDVGGDGGNTTANTGLGGGTDPNDGTTAPAPDPDPNAVDPNNPNPNPDPNNPNPNPDPNNPNPNPNPNPGTATLGLKVTGSHSGTGENRNCLSINVNGAPLSIGCSKVAGSASACFKNASPLFDTKAVAGVKEGMDNPATVTVVTTFPDKTNISSGDYERSGCMSNEYKYGYAGTAGQQISAATTATSTGAARFKCFKAKKDAHTTIYKLCYEDSRNFAGAMAPTHTDAYVRLEATKTTVSFVGVTCADSATLAGESMATACQ